MDRTLSLAFMAAVVIVGSRAFADEDKGETPAMMALKMRAAAPKESDIDAGVTLDNLLAKGGESDWSVKKAARIEGYVIQVEKEEDGDVHVTLASAAGEWDTRKWVIVEATPSWAKKNVALTAKSLRKLHGKKIQVT